MATINFFIQSDKNPSGIYVRLKEGRNIDAKAKTKYVINPKDWSFKKGAPTNLKDESSKKLDVELSKFKNDLLNHYNACVGKSKIDSKWLKEFINPPLEVEAIPSKLVDYFDYYALHTKSAIKPSTHTKIKVNKHLIERFQNDMGIEYLIKDVNADFKLKFEDFCSSNNYSLNTIARAIRFIKTVCYHARNNGVETHFQLDGIETKIVKVEKVFLSVEEIELIRKVELEQDFLDNARDWLVISCETGQRVSDFLRFTKENIRYEEMKIKEKVVNVPFMEFTQIKTEKIMSIPLSPIVVAILGKRDGNFPRKISDVHYNEYIKLVCEKAGLTQRVNGSKVNKVTKRKEAGIFSKFELVTSHIGRRSFATNNYARVPTSLLMNATGHTTEKMFLEYLGKTPPEKARQLAEYFV